MFCFRSTLPSLPGYCPGQGRWGFLETEGTNEGVPSRGGPRLTLNPPLPPKAGAV